jgi:ATP-dependent protease ClpP protease subunit
MSRTKDVDKEKLRLDYLFDQGVNFVDRVIQINEEIDDHSFAFIDAALSELERASKKTITIRINSPGGSVYDALAMIGKQERQWCSWMAELSEKDAEFWYDKTYKKNFYLTPDECLDYGVIDEIF